MPIYEYRCESCGQQTEVMQRLSDPPLETCDDCKGKLRKLVSAPAFQFKGSGWYVTDYARKGAEGSGKGDKESKADSKEAASQDKSSDSGSADGGPKSSASSAPSSSSKTSDSQKGSGD